MPLPKAARRHAVRAPFSTRRQRQRGVACRRRACSHLSGTSRCRRRRPSASHADHACPAGRANGCPTEATGQGNADRPLPNYKRSQMTPAIGCTLPTPQCGWGRCTRSVVCAAQRTAVRAVACAHVRGCVRGAECARGARVAAPRAASAKALDRRAVRCRLRVARRIFVSPEAIGGRRQSLLERLARHAVYPLAPAAAPAVAFGKVVANVRLRRPRCVRRLHVAAGTMSWDTMTCVARAPRGGCYRRTFHRSTAARDRSTAGACL